MNEFFYDDKRVLQADCGAGYTHLCCCCLVTKLCLTLYCDPIDYSPPGSSVMGFSRQEYWSGLLFPSLRDLPDPGIEPVFSALAGGFFTTEPPGR